MRKAFFGFADVFGRKDSSQQCSQPKNYDKRQTRKWQDKITVHCWAWRVFICRVDPQWQTYVLTYLSHHRQKPEEQVCQEERDFAESYCQCFTFTIEICRSWRHKIGLLFVRVSRLCWSSFWIHLWQVDEALSMRRASKTDQLTQAIFYVLVIYELHFSVLLLGWPVCGYQAQMAPLYQSKIPESHDLTSYWNSYAYHMLTYWRIKINLIL